MNKKEVKAIVTALSPISHGQIRAKDDGDTEKNILRFRTLPFILEQNGLPITKDLYTVSGNSLRINNISFRCFIRILSVMREIRNRPADIF